MLSEDQSAHARYVYSEEPELAPVHTVVEYEC